MTRGTPRSIPPSGGTPAITALQALKIDFDLHRYDHDPQCLDFGDEAVRALGLALGCAPMSVFKSLVWTIDERPCLALVPVPTLISPKRLASALGGHRAALADARLAERVSGSHLGAISPIAPRREVPVVIDESVEEHLRVFVSAGRRGLELAMTPTDLVRASRARLAPIAGGPTES